MKNYAFRLKPNEELKSKIKELVYENNINAGIIISCVGSTKFLKIRLGDGKSIREFNEELEIVSLEGNLCEDKCHIHISVSDIKGNVYGGHLKEAIINTTAEIVICDLEEFQFSREPDENTGFDELVIKNK